MPSVTFSPGQLISEALNPPAGATGVIIRAHFTPPTGQAAAYRLLHVRLAGKGEKPRDTEIVELLYRPGGGFTAGFSGLGVNHARHLPVHMGPALGEWDVTITIPFTGHNVVVAVGDKVATSDTDLAPNGRPLELLAGIRDTSELSSPAGSVMSWDEHAVEWVGVQQPAPPIQPPSAPPAQPPVQPPVPAPAPPVVTPPVPPIVLPPAGATASPEQAALQALALQLASGQPVNAQTLLAALLPILLQRIG